MSIAEEYSMFSTYKSDTFQFKIPVSKSEIGQFFRHLSFFMEPPVAAEEHYSNSLKFSSEWSYFTARQTV